MMDLQINRSQIRDLTPNLIERMEKKGHHVNKHESVYCLINAFAG